MTATKRSVGRPREGRLMFSRAIVDQVPERGSIRAVARALGVWQNAVQQWAHRDNDPMPVLRRKGKTVVSKGMLVNWLVKNGMYAPWSAN